MSEEISQSDFGCLTESGNRVASSLAQALVREIEDGAFPAWEPVRQEIERILSVLATFDPGAREPAAGRAICGLVRPALEARGIPGHLVSGRNIGYRKADPVAVDRAMAVASLIEDGSIGYRSAIRALTEDVIAVPGRRGSVVIDEDEYARMHGADEDAHPGL